MLEGADETWTKTSSAQRVSYNKLPAGEYLFRVKASADGLLWVEAPNPFTFQIKTPWWRSRWFSTACLLAGILVTVFFLRLRRSTIQIGRASCRERVCKYV